MKGAPLHKSHLPLVETHVRRLYEKLPEIYHYHTLEHTETVVRAALIIAEHENMSEHQKLLIEVAGWFHDVGYPRSVHGHEELSAFRSLLMLTRIGVCFEDVEVIEGCIMVTMLGTEPSNSIQAVLCDADMYHLASDDFWEWSTRLRKEWEATKGLHFTDAGWVENNIRFMNSVRYYTAYGRTVLEPAKQANIAKLTSMGQQL